MALYTKVSGVWKTVNKVYTKISGVWKNVDMVYIKVSGIWKGLFASEYTYTFTANAANVDFATLIGADNVAAYQKFKIIVNPGVTVYGTNGANGANNTNNTSVTRGAVIKRTCKNRYGVVGTSLNSSDTWYTGNGGNGGAGNIALNLSGLSGKTITIVNNGTIRGGNGGYGGAGAATNYITYYWLPGASCYSVSPSIQCGLSGAPGSGGSGVYNGSNTVSVSGNVPSNGVAGGIYYGYVGDNSCCGGCG